MTKDECMKRIETFAKQKIVKPNNVRMNEVNAFLMMYESLMQSDSDSPERLNTTERNYALRVLSDYLLADILKDRTTSKDKGREFPILSPMQVKRRGRKEIPVAVIYATGIRKGREQVEDI